MKRLFSTILLLVFCASCIFATKSENDLKKLYVGMPLKEVRSIFGEPTYSQYSKETKIRMLLYSVYKQGGGLTEYNFYFKNDSLSYITDKQDVRKPIMGEEGTIAQRDNGEFYVVDEYTIEGKSVVITKIIENIPLTNTEIQEALYVAISRACNGSMGEFKLNEPTRILYHGIIDNVVTFDRIWGRINVYYTIDIAVKQGRVRVKVIGEEIDWHQDNDRKTYYFSEAFPIGDVMMKDVPTETAREVLRITVESFKQYINVIEEEINKKGSGDDDW